MQNVFEEWLDDAAFGPVPHSEESAIDSGMSVETCHESDVETGCNGHSFSQKADNASLENLLEELLEDGNDIFDAPVSLSHSPETVFCYDTTCHGTCKLVSGNGTDRYAYTCRACGVSHSQNRHGGGDRKVCNRATAAQSRRANGYKCSRCGQPKAGHRCPMQLRSVGPPSSAVAQSPMLSGAYVQQSPAFLQQSPAFMHPSPIASPTFLQLAPHLQMESPPTALSAYSPSLSEAASATARLRAGDVASGLSNLTRSNTTDVMMGEMFAEPTASITCNVTDDEFDLEPDAIDLAWMCASSAELENFTTPIPDSPYAISAQMVLDNMELKRLHVFHDGNELIYAFLACQGGCGHADPCRLPLSIVPPQDREASLKCRELVRPWLEPIITPALLRQFDRTPTSSDDICGIDMQLASFVLKALAEIYEINIVIWHEQHMDSSTYEHRVIMHGDTKGSGQWQPRDFSKQTAVEIYKQNPTPSKWCHLRAYFDDTLCEGSQYSAYA